MKKIAMINETKKINLAKQLLCLIASCVLIYLPTQSWAEADPHAHHKAMMKNTDSFKRSIQSYKLPDLTLVDKKGVKTSVKKLFNQDKTIMVNFIFTTCNTICPIMSGTFAQVDKNLDKIGKKVELISISIDPEFDTPNVLESYAKKFNGSKKWKFYTGNRDDIIKLLTAFNAYRGSKMNHVPITLLRKTNSEEWIRIDGFASAKALIQQVQDTDHKQELGSQYSHSHH